MKWTASQVKRYSDAMVSGLLEMSLLPGAMIVTCLPTDSAEFHILQLTCCRGGFVLGHLPETSDPAVFAKVLKETRAVAVVTPEATRTFSYIDVLQEAMPELERYDNALGVPFDSKDFPAFKYAIHTGFDLIRGFSNFKHLMAFNDELGGAPKSPKESDVIYVEFDGKTGKKGKTMTHKEVQDEQVESWKVVVDMVGGKYIEP